MFLPQYNIEKRVTEDDEEDEDDDYTFGPRPKQDDNQAPMSSKYLEIFVPFLFAGRCGKFPKILLLTFIFSHIQGTHIDGF